MGIMERIDPSVVERKARERGLIRNQDIKLSQRG